MKAAEGLPQFYILQLLSGQVEKLGFDGPIDPAFSAFICGYDLHLVSGISYFVCWMSKVGSRMSETCCLPSLFCFLRELDVTDGLFH